MVVNGSEQTLDLAELKKAIQAEVDAQREQLVELSQKIHANPELGFQETKAQAWLTEYLADSGFKIEKGTGGMATAFQASYGQGKPIIALLAEYDGLPVLGHACGHNIIAAAAAGAGRAARLAADNYPGTIRVIGTPAEEVHGGKIILTERGTFKDVDAAMMTHPGVANMATVEALACISLEIEFFGKEAHAAANPERGINALEAMIVSFNAINALRQHIKPSARIHGIITEGGKAANIVPGYSAGNFLIRAEDNNYLNELKERVLDCFKAGASATGARLKYKWGDTRFEAMRNNMTLAKLFQDNIESLGRHIPTLEPYRALGSTDMGNVSQAVPSIHPILAIAGSEVIAHTREFAAAAAAGAGMRAMVDAAKALAMTAADLLAAPEVLKQVKSEFDSSFN